MHSSLKAGTELQQANCVLLEAGTHLTDLTGRAGSRSACLPTRFPLALQVLQYKVCAEGISGRGEAGGHTRCSGLGRALSLATALHTP